MPESCDLGVLCVHGIGEQRRGDTLLALGEPLTESLTDWFGADAVEWRRTELVAPPAGEPAQARLTIDRGGQRKQVLVAESWWADSFNEPGWWALAQWLVWALPFVVFRATDHRLSLVETNQKIDDVWKRRAFLRWLGYQAVRVVKNALSVAVVVLVTIVLGLLGVVALIPRVRRAIMSTQKLLIRYIGDSYYLLRSPGRADAMVAQVEHDLAWLESQSVRRVAILAHSQGAEVVRRVLARRRKQRRVDLLITFGSGIAKLRAVGRLHGQAAKAGWAYALRVLAAALTVAGPLLAVRYDLGLPVAVTAVLAGAILSGLLIWRARRLLQQVVQAEQLADELCAVGPEKLRRWMDFYATSDPVPEGALPLEKLQRTLAVASSTRIANRRSPLFDHTSYPQNGEAFRPAVLGALAELVGWKLSKPAMAAIYTARAQRERRTRTLVAARFVVAAAAAAVLALPRLDVGRAPWDDVAGWLGARSGSLAGLLSEAWQERLNGHTERDALAAAVLVLVALAVYGLFASIWHRAADKRAASLFAQPCGAQPVGEEIGLFRRAAYGIVARIAQRVDRKSGWESLPRLRGTFVLFGLRVNLRRHNLYDTPAADPPAHTTYVPRVIERTVDGRDNDLYDDDMGATGEYFGRNGPAFGQNGSPSPKTIADRLLARDKFVAADKLNLLAAAWVQFEVHDWMQHRPRSDRRSYPHTNGGPLVDGTPPLTRANGSSNGSPRFISNQTHWWDASQLYGADPRFSSTLRIENGRVKTDAALLQAIEESQTSSPGAVPNLWLGLALFHLLFAREHNAICSALEEDEPRLKGEQLFATARLINAAVMAKIHTVEWTPAMIAHPTTAHSIRATWWGLLGEGWRKRVGRIGSGEVLSGIPGSRTHHDGVRYSLTEEFVAVYRMHPLIPDTVEFHQLDGAKGTTRPFAELTAGASPTNPGKALEEIGHGSAFYSLGMEHPGAITLRNYPQFLRKLPQPLKDGETEPSLVDLAVRDIERTRETALPRYNDFRRLFRLEPAREFSDIADGKRDVAEAMREVYGTVDAVDLMVGLFGERRPEGFAFSDTAFRVFLLMAARRLRSDRFFTTDFTPEVYTATGLRWIQDRTLAKMLAEHYPELESVLPRDGNIFTPWKSAPSARG